MTLPPYASPEKEKSPSIPERPKSASMSHSSAPIAARQGRNEWSMARSICESVPSRNTWKFAPLWPVISSPPLTWNSGA